MVTACIKCLLQRLLCTSTYKHLQGYGRISLWELHQCLLGSRTVPIRLDMPHLRLQVLPACVAASAAGEVKVTWQTGEEKEGNNVDN